MDYAAGWPPPQPPLPPQHHLYSAPLEHHNLNLLPHPHPQQPPLPYTSPYYPNPNPNPSPILDYGYPPPPTAAAESYPPNPYAPHGGYSAGAADLVGDSGGLAAYYYERIAHAQDPPVSTKSKAKKVSKTNKVFKTNKVVQSAFCGVCKIDCNSQDVLNSHKQGKKHKKNLQKLQESITPKPSKALVTPTTSVTPVPGKGKGVGSVQKKRKAVPDEEDLETKKKKVLEGGAEPTEVMICTVCNVVVNSQKVFESHIYGQKHAANVKKLQQATPATS